MKALKRLERMGEAIQEFRPILSMILKEEQIWPDSAVKETSESLPDDSKIKEAAKKVSETKAAKNADLLISEVNELLGKPMEERSVGKNSNLKSKGKPRSHEDRPVTEPAAKDAEDKSDADPRRDFWVSLANQKIRI